MEVWAVANQKGGVGKTTTSVCLADCLANAGHRVLLVDLDPQGSLTCYFQQDPEAVTGTVYELFDKPEQARPIETGFDNLWLLPGSVALANLEKRAASLKGKGLVLGQWLKQQAPRFDYVVLDTPPALGMLMINALAACNRLIVPVQTDFLAVKGLERMLRVLDMLGSSGRRIDYVLLPTMFDQRTNASRRTLTYLRNQYEGKVSNLHIPVDTKLREASRLGVPPGFLFRGSHGVEAYANFVRELGPEECVT